MYPFQFCIWTRSNDISIWKEKLKIQDLHVFCFHSYYFLFCFFMSLLHCAPTILCNQMAQEHRTKATKKWAGRWGKEAQDWKSRQNQRSEQSSIALIKDNFWLYYKLKTDVIFPSQWPSAWHACVVVYMCLYHTLLYLLSLGFDWWSSKPESYFFFNAASCFLTSLRKGQWVLLPRQRTVIARRSLREVWDLSPHTWVTLGRCLLSFILGFFFRNLYFRGRLWVFMWSNTLRNGAHCLKRLSSTRNFLTSLQTVKVAKSCPQRFF